MCQFQDEMTQCHQFFHEVWTDEGLCFTFNLLNNEDILSELYVYQLKNLILSFWVQKKR